MKKVTLSNEAYTEFENFLKENNIDTYSIRINFAGSACSGPIFNITVDEAVTEDDIVEEINAVKFVINKNLIEDFGGFIILSTEENEGRGLSLKPVIGGEGGCGSCGGGCH